MADSLRPHGLYSPYSSLGQNTGVGSLSLLQGIFPTQGSNPGLPHCGMDSLLAEPQGKPKNTGVGSLSLLQRNFLTQELNQDLLHCRWILYQLSYQGSPNTLYPTPPPSIEQKLSSCTHVAFTLLQKEQNFRGYFLAMLKKKMI